MKSWLLALGLNLAGRWSARLEPVISEEDLVWTIPIVLLAHVTDLQRDVVGAALSPCNVWVTPLTELGVPALAQFAQQVIVAIMLLLLLLEEHHLLVEAVAGEALVAE